MLSPAVQAGPEPGGALRLAAVTAGVGSVRVCACGLAGMACLLLAACARTLPRARQRLPPAAALPCRAVPQVFNPADAVSTITDTAWHLRAEAVPPEEEGLDQPGAMHVHCLQISREGGNVSARGAGRGGAGRGGAGRGGAGRGGQRCLCVGTPLLLSCGFPGCFAGAASRAALCVRQLAHERCGYSCRGGPAVASAIGAGCVPDPAHWQRHAGPPAVPLAPTCLSTGHPPSRPPICVHSPPAPRRRPSPSPTPSSWRWGRARRWASCGGACRRGWSCQRRSLRSGAPSPARECQDGAKTARVPCS